MVTHDNQNTEETDIENKREHPRKTCLESTLYATKKGVYEGVIKDIGAKGVFVATNVAGIPQTKLPEKGSLRR